MDDRLRALLLARRARRKASAALDITGEWFPEQRAFYDDAAQLVAAKCSRRAGKTRGGCAHFVREARRTQGGRFLYVNATRGEAERLAWYGNRNDGMAALVDRFGIRARPNLAKLEIHFPDTDAWIYLRGADDEPELRKALGGAYHEVWWDEAQKIPPKLATPIREVLLPALLDFGGRMRITGTCSRQMSGLFFDVTRPEVDRRQPGWSVHEWTLLDNPFFGYVTKAESGSYAVKWGVKSKAIKTFLDESEAAAFAREERWKHGVLGLQKLLGGPDVAPLDSPIMQREAFARWVREDAAYVYAVHRVPRAQLVWDAPILRSDGFPDVAKQLERLPWSWRDGFYALGVDIGYFPDPFAMVLWGWHPKDPALYEVASWKRTNLDSDAQVEAMRAIREQIAISVTVADAGGPVKGTVVGWSKSWANRYGLPIIEAEKSHKETAVDLLNTDILRGRVKLLDGGPLDQEMAELQWSQLVSGTGRRVEDPTLANHCCDGALYAHRHSYHHRFRPEEPRPEPGSEAWHLREEREMEQDALDGEGEGFLH